LWCATEPQADLNLQSALQFASPGSFQDWFFCSVLDSNPSAGMSKVSESTLDRGLTVLLAAKRFGRCSDGRIVVSQFCHERFLAPPSGTRDYEAFENTFDHSHPSQPRQNGNAAY
jgi:hypothetical protein